MTREVKIIIATALVIVAVMAVMRAIGPHRAQPATRSRHCPGCAAQPSINTIIPKLMLPRPENLDASSMFLPRPERRGEGALTYLPAPRPHGAGVGGARRTTGAASYGYEPTKKNFERWDNWIRDDFRSASWGLLLDEGTTILRAEAKLVETVISSTRRTMRIAGHVVPVACCPGPLASEVGNRLMKPNVGRDAIKSNHDIIGSHISSNPDDHTPFLSATYYDGADGRRHFSLRSTDASPAHCGKIAEEISARLNERHKLTIPTVIPKFNGGGHKNAAGFDAPIGWEGE